MTTFDVIINYDKEKAKILYKFLKSCRCSGLDGSILRLFIKGTRDVSYAYRIRKHSGNLYEYCYSLYKRDVEAPVELDKFIERTFLNYDRIFNW